jgi:hypothetical protein
MKAHEPKLIFDREIDGYKLVCSKCGKVLWWEDSSDPCVPLYPTLKINVEDGTNLKEKIK